MAILIYSRLSTWLILVYLTLYWVPRRRILWHRTISLCIDHTLDCSGSERTTSVFLTLILSPLSLVMSSQQVGTRTVSTKIMHLQLCQRELFWLLGNNIADNPPNKQLYWHSSRQKTELQPAIICIFWQPDGSKMSSILYQIQNLMHTLAHIDNGKNTWTILQSHFKALHILPLCCVCRQMFEFSAQPLCSVPAAGFSWGGFDVCRPSLHIFTPSQRFWGFAEKQFLFRNWNLLAWNQLDFIPELYISPWIIAGTAF